MNDAYREALKEAYALAPSSKVILNTLEVRQDGVQEPVFLVQSRRSFSALDENGVARLFEPAGFQFSLPASSDEGFRSLTVGMDNIDRRVSDFIETAQSQEQPVKIIFRPYLSDDVTQPQMDPPLTLFLKDVEMNIQQVTGQATFMDIVNMKFPSEIYTREMFPTLG